MTQIQEHFQMSSNYEEAKDTSCMESEDAEGRDADENFAWTHDMLQNRRRKN